MTALHTSSPRRSAHGAAMPVWRRRIRWAAAVVAPLALTAVLRRLGGSVNPTEAALAYLLLTLACATLGGFPQAVTASLVSTLVFNYSFLPPVGSLTIADPANWAALFTFLVTAAVTSRLVTTARRTSAEATARAREALRLQECSRLLLAVTGPGDGPEQVLQAANGILCAQACGFVSWTEAGVRCEPEGALPDALSELPRPGSGPGMTGPMPADGGWLLLLPLGRQRPPHALAARYREPGDAPTAATRESLASLVALALDRMQLLAESLDAEVVRESEAFKSALLSSVSHDVRTPLAAARVSATALQDPAVWGDVHMRGELLSTLDEATTRLNRAVGNILCMSRIEAGRMDLGLRPCAPSEVIAAAIELVGPRRIGQRLQVALAPETPALHCDVGLMALVVANLVDNAIKYAPEGSPIELRCEPCPEGVRLAVLDRGCGIAPGEETAVFDAFRRGARRPATVGATGGLGLGLSIARALAQAHGGSVHLHPRAGGGTEAAVTLPRQAAGGRFGTAALAGTGSVSGPGSGRG